MRKQLGYTLTELFIVLGAIATMVGIGLGLWVIVHFIAKVW